MHRLKAALYAHCAHDTIYDSEYFEDFNGASFRSAGTIADSIVREFAPTSVIDVGCGTGALLKALRDRGCAVFGLDYSEAALVHCRSSRLNVAKFDLEADVLADGPFDVAVSMEVAEHLPLSVADRYVELLTQASQVIVFTAAHPGQGGVDHVNEQPASYWVSKFEQRGFTHAGELSQFMSEDWETAGDVEPWYYQNLMVFSRRRAAFSSHDLSS